MPQIGIGVDNGIEDDLTRSQIHPPAGSWTVAMPATIDSLDAGEGKLNMLNPSTAFFDYKLPNGLTFKFMVTYTPNGLGGQGAAPPGYQVGTQVDPDAITFSVAEQ